MPSGYRAVIARPLAISIPCVNPEAIRKQNRVYDWAWSPPARSAYSRDDWSPVLFVNRTLLASEFAAVESSAIVESVDDSASHWPSDPDSKSSLKYVPGARPLPDKATRCGLSAALSLTVNDPARAPVADGVKVTDTEQLAPAANVAGQPLVSAKSG